MQHFKSAQYPAAARAHRHEKTAQHAPAEREVGIEAQFHGTTPGVCGADSVRLRAAVACGAWDAQSAVWRAPAARRYLGPALNSLVKRTASSKFLLTNCLLSAGFMRLMQV